MSSPLATTSLPDLPVRRGKVRDIYELDDCFLIVACDRISAFDVVLPDAIPDKGRILTSISEFWFDKFSHVANHLIGVVGSTAPAGLETHLDQLRGRTMVCRKCEVVPIECVVRGYLAGSGWKDYGKTQSVCGVRLPEGLQQCAVLPEPIFTPATKVDDGHDENISFERACDVVGSELMHRLRDHSVEIYLAAAEYAAQHGVIIADTKFEWGLCDGELLLVDEVLTPDSSRFWPATDYQAGRDQDSYDKQYVRNYLQGLCDRGQWDKSPPAPHLPEEIIKNTSLKYIDAYERLTGRDYDGS